MINFEWVRNFFRKITVKTEKCLNSAYHALDDKNPILTSPPILIALLLLSTIIIVTILLKLPIATNIPITWLQAFFTATSAVDVTGLIVVDTATTFTWFGKLIILTAIQIGGLGAATIFCLFYIYLKDKANILIDSVKAERRTFRMTDNDVIDLVKYTIKVTLICEALGALLYSFVFIPHFGIINGIGSSIFVAVSAFCNAGFAPFSDSLISFASNPIIVWTTNALIIIGGLGFIAIYEINNYLTNWIQKKPQKMMSTTVVMVLLMTVILRLSSAGLIWLAEKNNPATIANKTTYQQYAYSQSISTTVATAGFEFIDTAKLTPASIFIMMFGMLTGGSPGSTAGGIKTTTPLVLFLFIFYKVFKDKNQAPLPRREFEYIDSDLFNFAVAILFSYLSIIFISTIAILILEPTLSFVEVLFETTSAINTVGLSMGWTTAKLGSVSQLIICLLMFLGRIGPLTLAYLSANINPEIDRLERTATEINIG